MNQDQFFQGAMYDPVKVKAAFVDAMKQAFANMSDNQADVARARMIKFLGQYQIQYLTENDSVETVSAELFGDEIWRNWVYATRFIFTMSIASGFGREVTYMLVKDLAAAQSEDIDLRQALSDDDSVSKDIAGAVDSVEKTPPNLVDDMSSYDQALAAITANPWLIVLLLAHAYTDIDHEVYKRPQDKNK